MAYNFTEALMTLKRKTALQGRPISRQETAGVAEGYAEKSMQSMQLGLQAKDIETREKMEAARLAQRKKEVEMEKNAAEEAYKRERKSNVGGVMGGAVGFSLGGPIGGLVGMGIGKMLGGSCLIITACAGLGSFPVFIARKYRDKYLGPITLKGYYRMSPCVANLITRYPLFKRLIRIVLVNRLVDYGAWLLGYRSKKVYRTSPIVEKLFLTLCYLIGRSSYVK